MRHLEHLKKVLPSYGIGPLKDAASRVMSESARLEGSVAPETARGLGEQLRLLNAYHSNLIEGVKTGILEIRKALKGQYSPGDAQRYAQELCVAHVHTERMVMERIAAGEADPFAPEFLPWLHTTFYSQLPPEHQFCHSGNGFTEHPVMLGTFRDLPVTVDGENQLGPDAEDVPELFRSLLSLYSPQNHYGDERLLAILSLHHRLAWLHPFRDGNGRMVRLHTTAAMAHAGINTAGLWSLSRGLSRNKNEYYIHLRFADEFETSRADEHLSDFIELCLEQCLDQIQFVGKLLDLTTFEGRVEAYLKNLQRRAKALGDEKLLKVAGRPGLTSLLRETFRNGTITRSRAYAILGVQRKTGAEVLKTLIDKGLLVKGKSQKAPLTCGFPEDAMPTYFPYLFKPSVMRDVEANTVVHTEPVEGLLLREGDKAKIATGSGDLLEIGRWQESFTSLLGQRVQAFVHEGVLRVLPA